MDTPIEERYLFPDPSWWGSATVSQSDKEFLVIKEMVNAEVIAITDSDADGLSSMAIIDEAYPDKNVVHIESGHGGQVIPVTDALELILEYHGKSHSWGINEIFIADICFDGEELDNVLELVEKLENNHTVNVFDHHNWNPLSIEKTTEKASNVVIESEAEDVCTASITFDELRDKIAKDNPDALMKMKDLAEVTCDHDLYIKEDERSDDISDLSFWATSEEYIDAVKRKGPDVMEYDKIRNLLEEERKEKERRIELAVQNAEFYRIKRKSLDEYEYVQIEDEVSPELKEGPIVAVAYGDVYASEVGNRLVNNDEDADYPAHLAIIIQPWDKVSLRGNKDFRFCADIAEKIGGGGHPTSAGCSTGLLGKNGKISYREHWDTKGQLVKETLLDATVEFFEEDYEPGQEQNQPENEEQKE